MFLLPFAFAAAPPPIVNGEKTDDYAEVVLLRHTTSDGSVAFVCSGTLITDRAVLTAAHCLMPVDGYNLTQVRVFSGSVWNDQAPERQASDWETHPDYSVSDDGMEITSDLGIVFLDEPYQLEGRVLNADPISDADVGSSFRYVGWGSSSDTVNDQGYYKRVADIPLDSLEGEFLLGYDGEHGSATCGGDSGGAVFEIAAGVATNLAGVHSFGRDDDGTICAGSTSGDTRVDLFAEWIVAETGAQTDTPEVADVGDDSGNAADQDSLGNDASDTDAALCGTANLPLGWLVSAVGAGLLARRRYQTGMFQIA